MENINDLEKQYINDDNDKTEIAIKTNLSVEQIFKNGFMEIFKIVGIENCGVKSLSGGKQQKKAKEYILQYIEIIERKDISRNAIQILDIFDIPHYIEKKDKKEKKDKNVTHCIEKDDKRGKRGFYVDRAKYIMVDYLKKQDDTTIKTNVTELSKLLGIVNNLFRNISYDDLSEKDSRFSRYMVNQFYFKCKPQQESVIYSILNSLQNNYSILCYYRNYCIITDNGTHTSSKDEDMIIMKAQRKVLKEFGVNKISTIYMRKKEKEFYSRVCSYINDEYGYNWCGYRQQIEIYINTKELNEISKELIIDSSDMCSKKQEMNHRFKERIINRTDYDFNRTNFIADKEIEKKYEEFKKVIDSNHEVKNLIDLGIVTYDELFEKEKLKVFKYNDSYLETQYSLINVLIENDY